jgi:hypothetical protein
VKTLIAILTVCAISPAFAQEHAPPMHAAPAQVDAKIIAENEFVQVVRMSISGHASTPLHDVTPRVVIWLRDAHFVDRFADGTAKEERRKSGDAEWVPMRRHSGQNLSDEPMEFIAVIVKAATVSGQSGQATSPHQ